MKIGYIGLGRMGKNMVLHLLEQGVEVMAWNRSPGPLQEVVEAGAIGANSPEDLIKKLEAPRTVWLMLPAGEVVDEFIDKILPFLEKDDLVIDGGNSFYKDSQSRDRKLSQKGIHFMDIGVSGGPKGAREGACLMIGGSVEDFQKIEPLCQKAAAPAAYQYLGPVGAGHFAKMVHNGIEYGMMEAIGEGIAVLAASGMNLNLAEIFRIYNNKSVIESRLVGWTEEALTEDPELEGYSSVIGHTGEGEWTINTAKDLGVEVPVLENSFQVRVNSAKEKDNIRNRAISAMRGKFGGHAVKKNG